MWGGHVFLYVCFTGGLFAEMMANKKSFENEGKDQVTCVTEGCVCNSQLGRRTYALKKKKK